jgi:hypothetical protein
MKPLYLILFSILACNAEKPDINSATRSASIDKDAWNDDVFAENTELLMPSDELITSLLKNQLGSSEDFDGVRNIEIGGANGDSIIFLDADNDTVNLNGMEQCGFTRGESSTRFISQYLVSDNGYAEGTTDERNINYTTKFCGELEVQSGYGIGEEGAIWNPDYKVEKLNAEKYEDRMRDGSKKVAVKASMGTYFNTLSYDETQQLSKLKRSGNTENCSVMTAKQIIQRGDNGKCKTRIEFSEAVPFFVNTTVSFRRFLQDVGRSKSFSNVTARIYSNNPSVYPKRNKFSEKDECDQSKYNNLPFVEERTGKVDIILFKPDRTITTARNTEVTFKADYAYRILTKFEPRSGDSSKDNQLDSSGLLNSAVDYYIKNGEIIGVIEKNARKELSLVVYEPQSSKSFQCRSGI